MKTKSEFGKGLTYCLALFLCHSERDYHREGIQDEKVREILFRPELFFYAACDHLYELQIPSSLPKELKVRIKEFCHKCLTWRNAMGKEAPTKEDKTWAIQEAKELIRLTDGHFGIKTIKG